MVKRSLLHSTILRSTLKSVVLSSTLFGIQLATAEAPWGDFGSGTATLVQSSFCKGNASYFGASARTIKAEIFIMLGTKRGPDGQKALGTEGIYAINRSLDWWPRIDVGVFNTNDTFAGRYLPFAYNEVYGVPLATPVYDDRFVVQYDGIGIHTSGTCRVRPSAN